MRPMIRPRCDDHCANGDQAEDRAPGVESSDLPAPPAQQTGRSYRQVSLGDASGRWIGPIRS